jgi:enoyl-CoA hydratase
MTVRLHYVDNVAVLTLDRPAALNALNFGMLEKLSEHLDSIAEASPRAVVVIGSGHRAFCAGADISELRGRSTEQHLGGAAFGQRVFAKVANLLMPTVAVIQGPALGGGLELALACNYRVAIAGAKLGLPEIKLGLIPGYGGTQRLPRLIGISKAMELISSGRIISADEAFELGLVDKVVENTDGNAPAIAQAYIAEVYDGRPAALQLAQEAVRSSATLYLDAGLSAEAKLFALAAKTADAVEGMDAFLAKRAPTFSGR